MKAIVSVLLSLILALAPATPVLAEAPSSAGSPAPISTGAPKPTAPPAATPRPTSQPTTATPNLADQITVTIPYFEGVDLQMTMTNSPQHAAIRQEFADASVDIEVLDFKVYFDADTILSFNKDMAFGGYKFAAGTQFKPADYPSGKLGAYILVAKGGFCTFNTGPAQNIQKGSKDYTFFLIDDIHYGTNIKREGYTALDPSKWKTTTITKDYRIDADFDKDGTTDYSYVIPSVLKVEAVQLVKPVEVKDPAVVAIAGTKINKFTVKAETKIHLDGASLSRLYLVELKNGGYDVVNPPADYAATHTRPSLTSADGKEHWKFVQVENGKQYPIWTSGTYKQFPYVGTYLYVLVPFVEQIYETDPYSPNFSLIKQGTAFQYNAVLIEVVK